MKGLAKAFQTTLIGGALFLLPFFLIWLMMDKLIDLLSGFSRPVAHWLGLDALGGIAASTIVTLVTAVVLAFLAGLFARTIHGRRFLAWFQGSLVSLFPRAGLIQDLAGNSDHGSIEVVLTPTDGGWLAALVLDRKGEWLTLFLPGSPEFQSGSIAFVLQRETRKLDVSAGQLWTIMRGRGSRSGMVLDWLESAGAAAIPSTVDSEAADEQQ